MTQEELPMSERKKPHNGRDKSGNFKVKQVDVDAMTSGWAALLRIPARQPVSSVSTSASW
jgi:hypothetical protein